MIVTGSWVEKNAMGEEMTVLRQNQT